MAAALRPLSRASPVIRIGRLLLSAVAPAFAWGCGGQSDNKGVGYVDSGVPLASLGGGTDLQVCVAYGSRFDPEMQCLGPRKAFAEHIVDPPATCPVANEPVCIVYPRSQHIWVFKGEHGGIPDGVNSFECDVDLDQSARAAPLCDAGPPKG